MHLRFIHAFFCGLTAHFFLSLNAILLYGLPVCLSIHPLKDILVADALHLVESFIVIIVDSHTIVRSNTEASMYALVSFTSNIIFLQNYYYTVL